MKQTAKLRQQQQQQQQRNAQKWRNKHTVKIDKTHIQSCVHILLIKD